MGHISKVWAQYANMNFYGSPGSLTQPLATGLSQGELLLVLVETMRYCTVWTMLYNK